MGKKIIALSIIFFILLQLSGLAITGYTNKKCYIYEKPSLSARKVQVEINTKLTYLDTINSFYKVKIKGKIAYIQKKNVSKTRTIVQQLKKIEKLTWAEGKSLFKRNSITYLTDATSNIKLQIKRLGGTNHFDVEPLTAADTEKLKKCNGGTYSWACHPGFLYMGTRKIACSFNTMPHGTQSIKNNNFNGQFCIHLIDSKTHGTKIINPEHQKAIELAYQLGQSNN